MRYNAARVIVHHHEAVRRMSDHWLEDFSRMGVSLIQGALANGNNFDQVLFRVEKNDPERLAIEKAHLGAQVGDGNRTIDCVRLTILS